MRKVEFIALMESTCLFNGSEVDQLVHLAEKYPYCAVAQKMSLRALYVDKDLRYDEKLAIVATVVRDRAKLHEYIISEKADDEIDAIDNVEVLKSEVSSDVLLDENILLPKKDDYFEGVPSFSFVNDYVSTEYMLSSDDEAEREVFTGDGAHSFSEWLNLMNIQRSLPVSTVETSTTSNGKWSLIDNFISEQPAIKRSTENGKPVKKIKEHVDVDTEEFITETLAQIYIKQKHYDKAISIFEKLSLKYPEKNTYFAAQIKLIEQFKNNEKE